MSFFLLLLICAGAGGASQEYEKLLAQGTEHLEEGRYKKALKAYSRADDLAGGDAEEPLLGLATAYIQQNRHEEAIETVERLLEFAESRQTLIHAYNMLGVSLYQKSEVDREDLERAEEALRKTVELIGDDGPTAGPLFSLAKVLKTQNRPNEALELLRQVLSQEPEGVRSKNARIEICRLRSSLGWSASRPATPESPANVRESEPVQIGGEVTSPERIHSPQPPYTADARRARVQGMVITQVIINKEGCVTNVKMLKGLEANAADGVVATELEDLVLETFAQWIFEPAKLNGRPVDIFYNLTTGFKVN